jgi:hypothetical protein
MSKITVREWYRRVNELWPATLPPLTGPEAIRAARRLYRFALGKSWPAGMTKITSGNRYTWIRRGVMSVNPHGHHGMAPWVGLVHDLSHYAHLKLHPGVRPHGRDHARIEIKMIRAVIDRGWLEGKLRDPMKIATAAITPEQIVAAKVTMRNEKLAEVLIALGRWENRLRRAKNAIKKLECRRKYYERFRHTTDEAVAPRGDG